MPLYTKPTRAELRATCRRDLMDPTGRWWSDSELNLYLDEWQQTIQTELEGVWKTSTLTLSTSTLTLTTTFPDMLRLDAIYLNGMRAHGRSQFAIEELYRDWANSTPSTPRAAFQPSLDTVAFWPPLSTSVQAIFDYPVVTTFTGDDDRIALPPYTRYSAVPFVAWKAYSRFGPNFNIDVALRHRRRFEEKLQTYTSIKQQFFPHHYPRLKVGGEYEAQILKIAPLVGVSEAMAISQFADYVPSGDVDGVNAVFTLPVTPTEAMVFKNGVLMKEGALADYTLSDQTITFNTPSLPQTGDLLIVWVYRR